MAAVLIVYLSTIDIDDYKEQIEESFLENTGLTLKINGTIDFDFDEDFHLNAGHIAIYDSQGILFEIDTMNIVTEFRWPKDSIVIHRLSIKNPTYHFRTKGISVQEVTSSRSSFLTFSLQKIIIDNIAVQNGVFILTNEMDSGVVAVSGIQTENGYLYLDIEKPILEGLFISAETKVREANAFAFNKEHLGCEFEMKDGFLKFSTTIYDRSKDKHLITLNLNPDFVEYSFQGEIRQEKIKSIYAHLDVPTEDFFTGKFDADYNLKFSIPDDSLDMKSISGNIKLVSENSILKGVSLDKLIKNFMRSQNFSMKDLGSVMLLGPWGLALSKGGDYAEMAIAASKDSTNIELLHFAFSVDSGLFRFDDVAFRTSKYRVALSGEIDVVNQSYKSFAYAVLDEEGCSKIREEFNGPFEESSNKGNSNMKMLLGPVTNLFKGSSSIIKDKDCANQYKGVVANPEKKYLFKAKTNKKEKKTQQKDEKTKAKEKKKENSGKKKKKKRKKE